MKAFCNTCKTITNFEIKRDYAKSHNNDDEGMWMEYKWQVVECKGCETPFFRYSEYGSESAYDPEEGPIEDDTYYPKRDRFTMPIKPFWNCPGKIRRIYRETVDAYNNNSYILCSGGLRAVIEAICQEENITDGSIEIKKGDGTKETKRSATLQGRISGLQEKGLITKPHSEILHEHRFLGNEALHELSLPSQEELKIAIEIIEHTIDNIYELIEKATDLQTLRERRKKCAGK